MKTNKFQLPELSQRKIKSVWSENIVHRKQGMRIEHETLKDKHLIHNYGQSLSAMDLAYGSAFIAIKAMMIKIDNNNASNVAVLGNNINAIMTCIQLIKRGFKITLYTPQQFKLLNMNEKTQKSAPSGYSLWFPDGYDWQQDLLKHELLSKFSYDYLQQCMRFHRYRSIHQTSVIQFNKSAEELRQVVSDLVFDNYRPINLDYGNGQHQQVITFNTVIIDNSLYLQELKTELILRGGRFATKRFKNVNDIISLNQQIVINCLGPMTKQVFSDDLVQIKQLIVVDLQVEQREKGRELNVRLHLDEDNYKIIERNGNLKIQLPLRTIPNNQSKQSYIQKHLFKLDAFFKTRRTQTAKL